MVLGRAYAPGEERDLRCRESTASRISYTSKRGGEKRKKSARIIISQLHIHLEHPPLIHRSFRSRQTRLPEIGIIHVSRTERDVAQVFFLEVCDFAEDSFEGHLAMYIG